MNLAVEKFKNFEWLMKGITAKSPSFGDESHGTGEKPLDYQDRLGAIAKMETQLEKAVTSVIIYGASSKADYEFLRTHLANIMVCEAKEDNRRDPDGIPIHHLAWQIAGMVIDFSLNPALEENFTAKGRLYYAGIKESQMGVDVYRVSWKQYEKTMQLCIELQIKHASDAIEKYRRQTLKELTA